MHQYASKGEAQSIKSKERTAATNTDHSQTRLTTPVQTRSLFAPSFNLKSRKENPNSNYTTNQSQPIPTLSFSPLQMQLMPKQKHREIQPLPLKMNENQEKFKPIPTKPNNTGIPLKMKEGFESLSGFSFDNVKVHYNSDKPAQLQALAYTQGNQVYVAPGQEKHLWHELGHVVQQKQGRVKPTMQSMGVNVNDNVDLESEAGEIGEFVKVRFGETARSVRGIHGEPELIQVKSEREVIQRVCDYCRKIVRNVYVPTHQRVCKCSPAEKLLRQNRNAVIDPEYALIGSDNEGISPLKSELQRCVLPTAPNPTMQLPATLSEELVREHLTQLNLSSTPLADQAVGQLGQNRQREFGECTQGRNDEWTNRMSSVGNAKIFRLHHPSIPEILASLETVDQQHFRNSAEQPPYLKQQPLTGTWKEIDILLGRGYTYFHDRQLLIPQGKFGSTQERDDFVSGTTRAQGVYIPSVLNHPPPIELLGEEHEEEHEVHEEEDDVEEDQAPQQTESKWLQAKIFPWNWLWVRRLLRLGKTQ